MSKARLNKPVLFMSAVAGGIIWFVCNYVYKLKIDGLLLIPILCSMLFATLFLVVWIGSVATGSFDRQSSCYSGFGSMVKYFAFGIVGVFCLTMLLEFLYELDPKQKIVEPSSYIFVIDESGSMSGNDPEGLRYDAILEIMDSPENTLPYMVYAFSSEPRILRDMGELTSNEPEIPITCDGSTAIGETILRILQDYKEGKWDGGDNPKIIFLTDGFATDLDDGFLWFKGNIPEFNNALEEYSDCGISISTVGLGSVDTELMRKMAETTGGVFISVDQATDLTAAMDTAATSYADRNLLSVRYMRHMDGLFGLFRIIFLSLIGALIGGLLVFAYMDVGSLHLIVTSSLVGSILGSILLEVGVQNGVYQGVLWFLLWILFAATLGYKYPNDRAFKRGNVMVSPKNQLRSDCQIKNEQKLKNVNIRV